MTTFGDISRFAIRYELADEPGGAWLYGKICFFLAAWKSETTLKGHPFGMRCSCLNAYLGIAATVRTLLEQRANDEQWARHNVTLGLDVFRDWKICLVEDRSTARLLFLRSDARGA